MSEGGTIAFYARVSSDAQARDHTIDSQVLALKQRIAADGFQLEPDHGYVDDGCSGSNLQRPALEKLRDAVAGGEVERIYVHAPDRLARSHAHQVLLIEEFRRAGAEMVFLNRTIGDTAEDNLLLQVQGIIAEYERSKILERVRRGRLHAARSGSVSALTGAPFGYRYICRDQGGGVAGGAGEHERGFRSPGPNQLVNVRLRSTKRLVKFGLSDGTPVGLTPHSSTWYVTWAGAHDSQRPAARVTRAKRLAGLQASRTAATSSTMSKSASCSTGITSMPLSCNAFNVSSPVSG